MEEGRRGRSTQRRMWADRGTDRGTDDSTGKWQNYFVVMDWKTAKCEQQAGDAKTGSVAEGRGREEGGGCREGDRESQRCHGASLASGERRRMSRRRRIDTWPIPRCT